MFLKKDAIMNLYEHITFAVIPDRESEELFLQ